MVVDFQGGLDRRSARLPVAKVGAVDRRSLFRLASTLERGDLEGAAALAAPAVAAARRSPSEAALRFAAIARTLLDLARAGWDVSVESGQIFAAAPKLADVHTRSEFDAAKQAVRGAMSARVREQVAEVGTARLIGELEPGVRKLLADPKRLAADLRKSGPSAIKPYLQLARRADGDDPESGLPLYSIFRYLRFWWSHPFGDTPGRSLPILIRDAGQPGHPVCGILCFASPVLRLTDRDDALGLTPAWLEAFVAALDIDAEGRRAGMSRWITQLRSLDRAGLSPEMMSRALASAAGIDASGGADGVARRVRQLPADVWDARRWAVASRVCVDLCADLLAAIELISFEDLGVTRAAALKRPRAESERLAILGEAARLAWEESRRAPKQNRTEEGEKLLYAKKRAIQMSGLLAAWADLEPIRLAAKKDGREALIALRGATSRRTSAFSASDPIEEGRRCGRGVSEAMLARKVSLASSQIADIALCGAVPPYDGLLGGKLAALMALSGDAARLYHGAYDGVASEIQSKMAGEAVKRSARLAAVTTTSMYGVGSSQYNRLALPSEIGGRRWDEVGETAGHGTVHFSSTAVALFNALLCRVRGVDLITATFGEGPSERMRKLRDGLTEIGFPAEELLNHGMSRISYVSAFRDAFPGAPRGADDGASFGPSAEDVVDFWRRRWVAPRLDAALERVAAFRPEAVVLSARFPSEVADGKAALASGATDASQLDFGKLAAS